MKNDKFAKLLSVISSYLILFATIAFVITCCMLLFVSTMSKTLGISLTSENLGVAAKLTFINVLFLSLLFTLLEFVRRRYTVSRPIKNITDATEKIMQGDFSVRIKPIRGLFDEDAFLPIIYAINNMAEELSGTETLRTDFIANVSHELKTPLAVMQNYGTMLGQPGLSEEKRIEYAKSITNASGRLANLITNILNLNKLENQQIFPSMEKYNLSEQLCECLLQFENIWEEKQIDIETDIEENISIYADNELLSLVWNNLFSNAFKFTESGGTVSANLTANEKYAIVKISDTGCGIKPETGEHIFEKFYQGDTSHSAQGNGLGLALVKRVVDIMQGEITVESVYGKGSSFTVKIPR